ncbi:type II toxin-antitoxin system RelE/ParE family toxin [Nostoc sp.]|uniref:type II toxin-antitoxin system RelE/ParE family toxin n=1 Tax=Nostoc sp. TaxID=1180 RepID=UPI002FF5AC54
MPDLYSYGEASYALRLPLGDAPHARLLVARASNKLDLFIYPLRWIASALNDLKKFPEDVQDVMVYALDLAQHGQKHPDAKPLHGFSRAGVLKIVDDFDGETVVRG